VSWPGRKKFFSPGRQVAQSTAAKKSLFFSALFPLPSSLRLNFSGGLRSKNYKEDRILFGEDRVMNKWKGLIRKVRAPQLLIGLLLSASLLTGCSANTPNQNPYMLTGAGLGAALGAGLGIASSPNNPWKGAAIGGLLGTAVGGVGGEMYGRSVNPPPYYQQPQAPPPAPSYAPPPPQAPQPGYSYNTPPSAPRYY
jgi:hypothetical protein